MSTVPVPGLQSAVDGGRTVTLKALSLCKIRREAEANALVDQARPVPRASADPAHGSWLAGQVPGDATADR